MGRNLPACARKRASRARGPRRRARETASLGIGRRPREIRRGPRPDRLRPAARENSRRSPSFAGSHRPGSPHPLPRCHAPTAIALSVRSVSPRPRAGGIAVRSSGARAGRIDAPDRSPPVRLRWFGPGDRRGRLVIVRARRHCALAIDRSRYPSTGPISTDPLRSRHRGPARPRRAAATYRPPDDAPAGVPTTRSGGPRGRPIVVWPFKYHALAIDRSLSSEPVSSDPLRLERTGSALLGQRPMLRPFPERYAPSSRSSPIPISGGGRHSARRGRGSPGAGTRARDRARRTQEPRGRARRLAWSGRDRRRREMGRTRRPDRPRPPIPRGEPPERTGSRVRHEPGGRRHERRLGDRPAQGRPETVDVAAGPPPGRHARRSIPRPTSGRRFRDRGRLDARLAREPRRQPAPDRSATPAA